MDVKVPTLIQIKKDLVSQGVLCHITFILDHFLPKWFVKRNLIEFSKGFQNFWRDIFNPMDLSNIIIAGSVSDAVNIPDIKERRDDESDAWDKHYDVDILYVADVIAGYDTDDEARYTIVTTNTYPGYFNLKAKPRSQFYFGLEDDCRDLTDFVGDVLSPDETESSFVCLDESHDENLYGICMSVLKNSGLKRCGPAYTEESDELSVDLVTTGKCSSWPPEAMDFYFRKTSSGWPSVDVKDKIFNLGCHFVSKAHSASSAPHLEYRFSFIMAEKTLLASLSLAQRQCFVIFKMMVKSMLEPYSTVSSYCLKTTLFWTLEKIPKHLWDDPVHGLATGFLGLLDTLIHFLANFCIPQYFFRENNLLANIPNEHIRGSLKKLVKLRQQPIDLLLDYDKRYEFRGKCLEPMLPYLKETTDQVELKNFRQTTVAECLRLQVSDTYQYLEHSISKRHFQTTLGLMMMLRCYEQTACLPRTQFLPYLEEKFPAVAAVDSCLELVDFLALVSSIIYQKKVDELEGPEGQDFVESAFEKALMNQHEDGLTHLYYGMFLLRCNKTTKAVSLLREALSFHNAGTLVSEYLSELSDMLDDTLKLLLSKYIIISADCYALCYHLLVDALMEEGRDDDAWQLMVEFDSRTNHSVQFFRNVNRTLVAFGYMRVGEHWNAALAFDSDAIFEGRLSKLSIRYADICRIVYLYDVYTKLIAHILLADDDGDDDDEEEEDV